MSTFDQAILSRQFHNGAHLIKSQKLVLLEKTYRPFFYCDYKIPPELTILLPALLADNIGMSQPQPSSLGRRQRKASNCSVPQGYICHGALLHSGVCLRPCTTIAELVKTNGHTFSVKTFYFVKCVFACPTVKTVLRYSKKKKPAFNL